MEVEVEVETRPLRVRPQRQHPRAFRAPSLVWAKAARLEVTIDTLIATTSAGVTTVPLAASRRQGACALPVLAGRLV